MVKARQKSSFVSGSSPAIRAYKWPSLRLLRRSIWCTCARRSSSVGPISLSAELASNFSMLRPPMRSPPGLERSTEMDLRLDLRLDVSATCPRGDVDRRSLSASPPKRARTLPTFEQLLASHMSLPPLACVGEGERGEELFRLLRDAARFRLERVDELVARDGPRACAEHVACEPTHGSSAHSVGEAWEWRRGSRREGARRVLDAPSSSSSVKSA
jgi:hypothetical protein